MATPTPAQQKAIQSLILDTGPLIKNTVSISTIINSAEELYTTPAILSEIRDEATRSRVQTTLIPFLKIRTPSAASYDAVIAFSKKTGDHSVLSRQDLGILALAYEIHCERNGGNFGLREAPRGPIQRRLGEEEDVKETEPKEKKSRNRRNRNNARSEEVDVIDPTAAEEGWEMPKGKRATKAKTVKPTKFNFEVAQEPAVAEGEVQQDAEQKATGEVAEEQGGVAITPELLGEQEVQEQPVVSAEIRKDVPATQEPQQSTTEENIDEQEAEAPKEQPIESEVINTDVEVEQQPETTQDLNEDETSDGEWVASDYYVASSAEIAEHSTASAPSELSRHVNDLSLSELTPPQSDDDSDGDWITPTNLPTHKAKDSGLLSTTRTTGTRQMDVATMTIDFAMQNVLLQMNLHLLSPNMQRIKNVNTKVLRCHACFSIVKDMSKQFCPRCGGATLARVSCSTTSKGEFRIHLARNYVHNKRGDKFSIPKPIAGTANTKWSGQGGGKGGWGRDLILAEDQKEFVRVKTEEERLKTRDLMDRDYLPGILTGDRQRGGGRAKVGAGRNVNAKNVR